MTSQITEHLKLDSHIQTRWPTEVARISWKRSLLLCCLHFIAFLSFICLGCHKREEQPTPEGGLRLVSLSPAITDILYDLGLTDHIIGVSKYCIPPAGHKVRVVGSMLSADTEVLLTLKPTHLFFQGLPDHFDNLKRLDPSIQTISLSVDSITEILKAVEKIGEVTGKRDLAHRARIEFEQKIHRVKQRVKGLSPKRVAFVLDSGRHMAMVAGPGSFTDDLISAAGGVNVARDLPGDQIWRKVQIESLLAAKPELLICQIDPSEPGARERVERKWSRYIGQSGISLKRVRIVSDRRWTIPSTRVADLALPMAKMIHPSLNR